MTIAAVRKQITNAMKDLHVTDAEVKKILKASAPSLSNGEVKAIGDLYDRVTSRPHAPPGAQICFVAGIDQPALNRLNTFIAAKNLPIGQNKPAARDAIQSVLSTVRLNGVGVAKPAGLSRLVSVQLSGPGIPGSTNSTAYVNVVTKQFYLHESKAILNGDKYYGPFALPKA